MIQKYIQSFNIFSEKEIQEAIPLFEYRKLEKYEFFAKEGRKCNELAFIESGIFHSFYSSLNGEEITLQISWENMMISAYSSFITNKVSKENIQALTTSEIWVLKKNKIEELIEKQVNWSRFLRTLADEKYLEIEQRIFDSQLYSAKERYEDILVNCPSCLERVSLKYLASYLGVTQRHLSRIRKELATF